MIILNLKEEFDSTYDNEASAIIDEVAGVDQAITFDLKKALCDENSCYFYDGKSLLYGRLSASLACRVRNKHWLDSKSPSQWQGSG